MSNYFNKVPNFEYVSRLPDANISDYIPVKNLFKKGALREDIFQNLSTFTKYIVSGDKRPDNVAFEFYGDSSLDWLVLASNNIVNVKTEWPMSQLEYNQYLLDKYGSYEKINEVHHYETVEIRNRDNVIMVQKGLKVASDYSITYFDERDGGLVTSYPVTPVTNYEYEDETAINPFDFWQGANFKLKLKKVAGYWNYDSSEFAAPGPLLDDDDALEALWKKEYSLTALTAADQFKSYEQLENRLKMVLGQKSAPARLDEEVSDEDNDRGSYAPDFSSRRSEPTPAKIGNNDFNAPDITPTSSSSEDEDDALSYFQKLAEE